MWIQVLMVIAAATLLLAAAMIVGNRRWNAHTRLLHARLEAAREPATPAIVDIRGLQNLPAPVQRYLRAALTDGGPTIATVSVAHSGTFNMGERGERWKSFTSTQRVMARRPGFVWDARIAMLPGLPVCVHDAYVAGEGLLHATLAGLVPLADLRGGELAHGELMRFLAEAVWYPTVLAPGQQVRWQAVDDRAADATLRDGDIEVTLRFAFNDDDLVDSVYTNARGRTVGGIIVPTPWQGRFWNYAQRDGMTIPLDGEVAWLTPDGPQPYWRGHVNDIRYAFARAPQ